MNPGPLLFLATFFAMALSWLGFVLAPQLQVGGQPQALVQATGEWYPPMRPGMARQGEQIYKANGCFYCHSQQVRPAGFGSDVQRGWGGRSGKVQSVHADYLYDSPAMLGNQRIGPDLANIGLRETNEMILLKRLYNPKSVMPGTFMPPYRFLFVKRKLGFAEKPGDDALPADAGVEPGYEVIPTEDAKELVAYLLSLHSSAVLYEAPPAPPNTNTVTKAAPSPSTNAPAK